MDLQANLSCLVPQWRWLILCGIETYNQLRCLTMEPEAALLKLLTPLVDLSFEKCIFLKENYNG